MLLKNIVYFSLLALLFTFSFSCKNDDEGGTGNSGPETFENSCCRIPHLEACVGGAKVFVPNAFTPNFDGINDLFLAQVGDGVSKINSFKVFDESGTTVFEKTDFQPNDPGFAWDGSVNGAIEPGIFYYTISILNISDETAIFDGHVCLRTSETDLPCVDLEAHCAYPAQHDGQGGFDFTLPSFETCQ